MSPDADTPRVPGPLFAGERCWPRGTGGCQLGCECCWLIGWKQTCTRSLPAYSISMDPQNLHHADTQALLGSRCTCDHLA